MRRIATRALALAAFGAAAAAGAYAVMAAVDRGPAGPTTASFGPVRIVRTPGEDHTVCFTVSRAGVLLKRTCVAAVGDGEIASTLARRRSGQLVVAGLAGHGIDAVVVDLRPAGTIAAQLADGAFYAPVPRGKTVKTVRSSR